MNPARLLFPALRWQEGPGFSQLEPLVAQALDYGVGGFILFGGPADEVARLTSRLRADSSCPLLIGADLERGAGQQFIGLPEIPPPAALASLGDLNVIRAAGAVTARSAISVGVDLIFAPVADLDQEPRNPIVQTRSFGADPDGVARAVAAWIDGCQGEGALATVKHFPGHGGTKTDSHAELPVVDSSRDALEAHLQPFKAALAADVAAVMTAHVSYPAIDPSGHPATLSRPVISLLREELGFGGLIVTDAMIMAGANQPTPELVSAAGPVGQAVLAGVDAVLYPENLTAARDSLLRAVADGTITEDRLADSISRLDHATRRAELSVTASTALAAADFGKVADQLAAGPMLRAELPLLRSPLEVKVVDDDIGGEFPAGPSDLVISELADDGLLGAGGSKVLLVFSEPRGWKGVAGFTRDGAARLEAAAPRADLIILFGHPRLAQQIPGDCPIKGAWHRQPLMQRAVARWLREATE